MGDYQDKVHKEGPNKLVVESGGTLEMKSGSTLIQSRAIQKLCNAGMRAGAGAGFTTAGNTSAALCPASQTASTLIIPVSGLKVGDTITAFQLVGQIESGGNAVTVDADLRKISAAAADPVDASLGAITQVSVIADAAIAASKTLVTPEVVAADEQFYIIVTATTLGSTDVQILGAVVSVTEA